VAKLDQKTLAVGIGGGGDLLAQARYVSQHPTEPHPQTSSRR
jgi:hypothetical protein